MLNSKNDIQKNVPTIYTVATAHLDTVWNWDLSQTIREYLVNTLKENFKLFEKYPNYNFNFEGAYRYHLIKEYYPELYEKLKEYIAQGRWFVTGSSWENGDVVIPSPEALMRNILYGNEFFRKEFGKTSNDIFLPDCFGFAYTLPTIAAHMGLKSFSSAKLVWNKGNALPFDYGIWKGPDGKEVVAVLNPMAYISRIDSDISEDEELANKINSYSIPKYMRYYGTGDVGGAPNEGSVANVSKGVENKNPRVIVKSAYAGQLADELTDEEREKLPVYQGELLMSTHAVGGYTSVGISKRLNRKNELLADAAERVSVAAHWLGGKNYPKKVLNESWKRFIAHQFHDDLPGTSLMRVYTNSWNDYILSLNQFAHELETGVAAVAEAMDTKVEKGVPLVLFNPVEQARKEVVEAEVCFDGPVPQYIKVFDPHGREVPSQVSEIHEKSLKILFVAEVGPNGFCVYNAVPSDKPCNINTGLSITNNTLENRFYRVRIDEKGNIASIYDKIAGRELLSAPITYQLLSNSFTTYGAWEILYEDVKAEPYAIVDGKPEISIVKEGPCQVALQIERHYRASAYKQVIRLNADESRRIDVENRIYWAETESFLKVAFPLTVSNPVATFDMGLGTIERPNMNPFLYEVPAQKWADITDSSGEYGVTIMNDCKYAWDKTCDNQLRLTLIHTPKNRWRDDSRQDLMDFGENRVNFSIMGHSGDYRKARSHIMASFMNQPVIAFQADRHDGFIGREYSFVSVSTDQVKINAIKHAEESDDVIVRLVEYHGKKAENVSFTLGAGIISAVEVNGAEEPVGKAEVKDGKVIFNINPWEPKTFAVKLKTAPGEVQKPIQKPVDLDYNLEAISFNGETIKGGMDFLKRSIPAELIDEIVTIGGIEFKFGPKGANMKNALFAKGQTINLPEGTTKLFIAASCVNNDEKAVFRVGSGEVALNIQSMRENIGGWDQYGLNHYGFIKRDTLLFAATHSHTSEGDAINEKLYIFKYEIEVPEGARTIVLPDNENIVIFAMTALLHNSGHNTKAVIPLYDVKEKAGLYTLNVIDGEGSGSYRTGNPVQVTYRGGQAGDVVWKDQYGREYCGINFTLNMPDRDLTLIPTVIPFGENLAREAKSIANAAEDSCDAINMFDSNDNTMWIAAGSGEKWAMIDLGTDQVVDCYIIKHTGFNGGDFKLNTSDWKMEVWNNDEWTVIDEVRANRLSANVRKFKPVKGRFFRIRVQKPTSDHIDTKARICSLEFYRQSDEKIAIECKYTSNPMEPSEKPDVASGLEKYIERIDVIPGGKGNIFEIRFKNEVSIERWIAKPLHEKVPCRLTLSYADEKDNWFFKDAATDNMGFDRIFTPFVSEKIRVETDCVISELPVEFYGKNLKPVLKAKWMAAEAQTRHFVPEYNPSDELPGALRLAEGPGSGHDIFGLCVNLKAGKATIGFKFKADVTALPDSTRLFFFNPLLPGGDLNIRDMDVADYNRMPKDENGYVTAYATFVVPGDCQVEVRIDNDRNAKLTFLEVYVYEGTVK